MGTNTSDVGVESGVFRYMLYDYYGMEHMKSYFSSRYMRYG